MRRLLRRVLETIVLILAAASCAHVSSRPEGAEDGLTAVEQWTEALYPGADFAARTWWIGAAARRDLAQSVVPVRSLPLHTPLVRRGARDQRPAQLQRALCDCVAHWFVPLILHESGDPRWEDLADELVRTRGGWWWHGIIRESSLAAFAHEYGEREAVFARLRGEIRERPPSIEEIAAGLLLTTDAVAKSIDDEDSVDPGDHLHPAYAYVADVPLTLAPLYALSAGADPDEVRDTMQSCFESLGEAQRLP